MAKHSPSKKFQTDTLIKVLIDAGEHVQDQVCVLQFVTVCCSVSQCVAVCCNVLQCVAVCRSVLQCVAVCCSVLQCASRRGQACVCRVAE